MISGASLTRRALSRLIAAATLARGARAEAAEPYEVVLESNIRVPMRDGLKLATDVYRPARNGKAVAGRFSAIMERTPYGRNVTSFRDITQANPKTPKTRAEVAAVYVRRGYVVVFQDCRGRNDSEGQFVKYLSEGDDGFDACRWLTAQPWSDGRIGTMGLSYAAHTQAALACLDPPGLKAMYIDCGGFSNAYQDGIRQGGAFELKQVTWAYNLGLEGPEAQKNPKLMAALKAVDLKAAFAAMPWAPGHTPLSLIPDYEAYVLDQWRHGTFDAYWKQVGIYAEGSYDRFADAAMIHLSGWYDAYSRSTTDNYVALSKKKTGPVRLIMGPWTHGARSTTYAGDIELGQGSTLDALGHGDYDAQRLAWFDRHLKGSSKSDPDPAVRIFVMGGGQDGKGVARKTPEGRLMHGGRWRAESAWPIAHARPTLFHLHGDGRLWESNPSPMAKPLSFVFDPAHPVPSIGGTITSGEPLMRGGGYDQREGPTVYGSRQPYRPLAARPDVLVFQTPPLSEDVEVTGAIEANLWIASDGPDTDFTIKLIDVYPPSADYPEGYALNLTDGILRCRYRDSWEKPTMMTPGQGYEIKVTAFPTSNLFKAGHRIRLDVSSSNFPHFDVNPNTGAPEGAGMTRRVARNTLFVDSGRPSHVLLPVIPKRG
jgi:putative CocE/NonD family hydrolase